jgi:phage terminase large subunit-like protein
MGWSTDTLAVTISTAGLNIMNYFYKQIAHGKMILETESNADDKTLYILFTLDDKDLEREDILTNEDIWVKANPNLGITPPMSKFKSDLEKAYLLDEDKQQFIIKNFNVFDSSINLDRLFSMTDVNRNSEKIDLESLYGSTIYLGLDLAPKIDISSIGAVVEKDGKFYSWVDLFCAGSKDALFRKGTKVNLADYKEFININWKQNVTDYDAIVDRMKWYTEHFRVIALGYDPAYSGTLISRITKVGIDCYPVKQYHISFNETVMMVENALAEDNIVIDNNPILKYMFYNCMSDENKQGMRMPAKKESKIYGDAIDGVVAMLSAFNMYIGNNIVESAIYQYINRESLRN